MQVLSNHGAEADIEVCNSKIEKTTPFLLRFHLSSQTTISVQVLLGFSHPNIVSCLETFEEDGRIHIIMEYCSQGENLNRAYTLCRTLTEEQGLPVPFGQHGGRKQETYRARSRQNRVYQSLRKLC